MTDDHTVRDRMQEVRDDRVQFRLDQAKRLTEENLDARGDMDGPRDPHHVPEFTQQYPSTPVDAALVEYGLQKSGLAAQAHALPTDAEERKGIPLVTGLLDYFPAALAEVAKVSKAGNDKHNPGEPLHWARGKSMDQADCIGRHLLERGGFDTETGQRHSAQMAWRALALLQLELEAAGAPMARGAA